MCTCTTNAAQPSSGIFFSETNWDVNYNLFSPLEWWSKQNVELEFVKKNELLHISGFVRLYNDFVYDMYAPGVIQDKIL